MDLSKENTIDVRNENAKVEYFKFCLACGTYFVALRDDRLTCSIPCKQRLSNRLKKGLEPIVTREMRGTPSDSIVEEFGFKKYKK